jgi:hypothetical protein
MLNQQPQIMSWVDKEQHDAAFPAWKALDNVVRQWAALSGHEKDQEKYEILKKMYQD